ncbi:MULTISPECIES: XdhC family protein [unclassified Streptomyces]|uniref:XdhC family protein n=1 Tax=unclassified Streptomyces TaxID=2593676 RepID=UPI0004BD1787|nr:MULTISPECIES: XdhC/CoxI family protein [unclassified Streptomyces]KOV74043.1 XshC-Cox1-family protein [Streptomyces sp. NRRL WC-3723]
MLDIAADLHRWIEHGHDFAVATVVAVSGSAPREPGAAMAVNGEGEVIGSVSGGCIEGAVYELCRQALADGLPVLERFGYSDETAFAVGLTCGGVIDVLVAPVRVGEPVGDVLASALSSVHSGEPVALARVVDGPAQLVGQGMVVRPDGSFEGVLGDRTQLTRKAVAEARAMLDVGRTSTILLEEEGANCRQPLTLLVEVSAPPPRLIVFGAIDFAAALVRLGKYLGYHVTVCDARPVFTTRDRFPEADDVVTDWPHRYLESTEVNHLTVLCVLTHDAKFDVPLLERALRLPVAYIGAIGSRRTHDDRLKRLRDVGMTDRELDRLHSPIGLDLGARTPEETAVSIVAEIIAHRHGGTALPLKTTRSPIHREVGRVSSQAAPQRVTAVSSH